MDKKIDIPHDNIPILHYLYLLPFIGKLNTGENADRCVGICHDSVYRMDYDIDFVVRIYKTYAE